MRLLQCLLGETTHARNGTRSLHAILTENDAYKSYSEVWLTATNFLSERALNSSALPAESEEKLLMEALVGAMHQFKPDPKTDPSQQIPGLVAKLEEILGGSDTELAGYVRQTIEGLQRLRVQIPDVEEVPDAPPADEKADTPKDAAPGEGQEEEQPQSEVSSLAAKLGLSDKPKPGGAPKPKPGLQDSVKLDRLMGKLLEQVPVPKPGDPIVTVKNGVTTRRQVVKSDANRTTVIDPDHPDHGAEDLPTREVGADQDPNAPVVPPGQGPSTSSGPKPSSSVPPRHV